MRIQLLIASLLAVTACRTEENPAPDLTVGIDLAVGDLPANIDLAGLDLTQVDLLNVDLYTPLFAAPVAYPVEHGPIFVAIADLNQDGKRDLVIASTNDPDGPDNNIGTTGDNVPSTVSVLLGNGDGTFQAKVSTPIDPYPQGIAVSDLNTDTRADVVVSVQDGFQVLLTAAGGTLGAPTKIAIPTTYARSIALGDIDNDGKLDAVLADLGVVTGKAWVSRGNGNGTFNTPVSFEVTSTATVYSTVVARIGDMNNDGKLDIVTANTEYPSATSNIVSILTNTSTPGTVSFASAPTEVPAGGIPFDLLLDQLDGANKLDMVLANFNENKLRVFLSDNAGSALTFGAAAQYVVGAGPIALAFADIDSDTKVDILVANSGASSVTVLYGGGGGLFGQATASRPGSETYPTGQDPVSIVAATFNADTKVDVVTANQVANNVTVLLNQR